MRHDHRELLARWQAQEARPVELLDAEGVQARAWASVWAAATTARPAELDQEGYMLGVSAIIGFYAAVFDVDPGEAAESLMRG